MMMMSNSTGSIDHPQNNNIYSDKLMTGAMKSPSLMSFGGTINTTNNLHSTKSVTNVFERNPLQEQSMNTSQVKQQNNQEIKQGMSINPKELSNEELEFIIKTGKLPQRLQGNYKENGSVGQNYIQQQQQVMNSSQSSQQVLAKTSQAMPLLQSYLVNPSHFDKENIHTDCDSYKNLKNYNSPRMIPDTYSHLTNHQPPPFNQGLLTAQIQPIDNQVLQQSSFVNMENSIYSKGFEISQPVNLQNNNSMTGNSQAASQAMKALSDKIKELENQNQLIKDKLQLQQSHTTQQTTMISQKMSMHLQEAQANEQQLREEIQRLQSEKERDRIGKENEEEKWRELYKKGEQENLILRKQLNDQISRYQDIDSSIQDIKQRESSLRVKYDQEIQSEKQKAMVYQKDVQDIQERYEQLKQKLQKKSKFLKQENIKLKSEIDQSQKDFQFEKYKLQRECDKWKREASLLKEEMSIIRSEQQEKENDHKNENRQTKQKSKRIANSGLQSGTPKAISQMNSARRCYSPAKQALLEKKVNKDNTLDLENFNSIDVKEQKIKQKKILSAKRQGSQTKSNNNLKKKSLHQNCKETSNQSGQKNHCQQDTKPQASERKTSRALRSASQNESQQKSKSKSRQRTQSSQKKQIKGEKQVISAVQSQANLISINTKAGKVDDYNLSSNVQNEQNDLIYVQNQNCQKFQNQDLLNTNSSLFNQFKRGSVESGTTLPPFGLMSSTTSDYGNLLFSHQSSIEPHLYGTNQSEFQAQKQLLDSVSQQRPLDIKDMSQSQSQDKQRIDNEIFYLEREIFDLNQQYKSLLSQSNTPQTLNSQSAPQLNQKLRQIAQMLEEKSERLFELKKLQQEKLIGSVMMSMTQSQTQLVANPFSQTQGFKNAY